MLGSFSVCRAPRSRAVLETSCPWPVRKLKGDQRQSHSRAQHSSQQQQEQEQQQRPTNGRTDEGERGKGEGAATTEGVGAGGSLRRQGSPGGAEPERERAEGRRARPLRCALAQAASDREGNERKQRTDKRRAPWDVLRCAALCCAVLRCAVLTVCALLCCAVRVLLFASKLLFCARVRWRLCTLRRWAGPTCACLCSTRAERTC
jgi:hypothetical protein